MYNEIEEYLLTNYRYTLDALFNEFGNDAKIMIQEIEQRGLLTPSTFEEQGELAEIIDDFIREHDYGIQRRKTFLRKCGI
jgi:hypothetical protein